MTDPLPPFKVKALYAYENDYEDDLTFAAGQIITVTVVEDDQWYTGTYDGKEGIFPRNFVEIYNELPPVPVSRPTPKSPVTETPAAPAAAPEPKETVVDETPAAPKSTVTPAALFPKPVLPGGHKVVDPYSVAKQFVATGKSSYVPQVTPRDLSNVIHTIQTSSASHAPPADVVRESSHTAIQDEEEPKVSLKERIALLKKRQEEEAEREAAALKREEERKRKAAEKAKLKKHKVLEQHATGDSIISTGSVETGAESSILHEPTQEGVEGEEHVKDTAATKEVDENDSPKGAANVEESEEEEEIEEEEDDEDEDDEEEPTEEEKEELKRRRLVERMAKISGGRNMFGMMGMPTPFGQAPPASVPKRTRSVKKLVDEPSETSRAKPVPILPMVGSNNLPLVLQKPTNPTETAKLSDSKPYPESESSAMIEDDVATESDSKILETEDYKVATRPSLASDGETDSYVPNIDSNIRITTTLEGEKEKEPTGYEADEDLSDITRTSTIRGVSALESPVKKSAPPAPPVPQVPPIPSLPRLSTGLKSDDLPTLKNAPPPPPIVSRAQQPAVPSSAPPVPLGPALAPPPLPLVPAPVSLLPPPLPSAPPIPATTVDDEDNGEDEDLVVVNQSDSDEVEDDTTDSEVEVQEEYGDSTSEEVGNRDIAQPVDSDEEQMAPPPVTLEAPAIPYGVPLVPKTLPFVPHVPAIPTSAPPPIGAEELTHGASPYAPVLRATTDASIGHKPSIKGDEQTNAELVLSELEFEIANITANSNWWLKGELPDSLIAKAGSELIYEVDSHEIHKRGGRVVNFRDYYVLFYDLSQLVFEIEFEKDDPRSSIKLVNSLIKPVPTIHKDLLSKYRNEFGDRVVLEASSLLGLVVTGDFVDLILNKFSKELVQPIGSKSCGVTIYKNFNNHNIAKIDDIRAGDILWMKSGKFQSHKVMGNNKVISVGDHEVHKSIIYEFDPRKDKIRVIEQESNGLIKKESYKLSDFKSGKLRVFRLVGRDYVDW